MLRLIILDLIIRYVCNRLQPGPLILSTALRDACFQDPDKCVFGDMIARSVAGGDNAFVVGSHALPRHAQQRGHLPQ